LCANLTCTRNRDLTSDDDGSYDVVVPPIENILLRSACCCGYCGCSCKPKDRPLGCTNERTLCCYQQQCGTQCLSTRVKKRVCCNCTCIQNMCACEERNSNEIKIGELSEFGMCCCCCEFGDALKISCCPTPLVCCGTLGQCLCFRYRCSFPCDSYTPCELGFCSVMCIDKSKMIATAEADYRKRKEESIVEAVIIDRKGLGAPAVAIEMDR